MSVQVIEKDGKPDSVAPYVGDIDEVVGGAMELPLPASLASLGWEQYQTNRECVFIRPRHPGN